MKHELAIAIGGLSLARPLALLALILPLAVWILTRTGSDARTIATGTLAIWRAVAEREPQSGNRRRVRASPAVWCAIAALVLGTLTLSAPRLASEPAARTWRLYVDRRPAMYLRDRDATRIERAVASARRWIADVARSGDEVIWIAASGRSPSSIRGLDPPAEWLRAPRIPISAPDWQSCDDSKSAWITDRAPSTEPHHAVLVLSGGAAVPGPVDASGTTRWDWDGQRIVEVPHGIAERRVAIEGDLTRPLARMLAAWASARGFSIDSKSSADVALRVTTRRAGPEESIVAGRDGWRAKGTVSGTAPAADDDGDLATWLDVAVGTERRALITRGIGRIASAWSSMEEPEGDPAAFAVSIASLFDACVLPPAGVVETRERLAAGSEEIRVPRETDGVTTSSANPIPAHDAGIALDRWFALSSLVAALAALGCALALRRRGARPTIARARPIG